LLTAGIVWSTQTITGVIAKACNCRLTNVSNRKIDSDSVMVSITQWNCIAYYSLLSVWMSFMLT